MPRPRRYDTITDGDSIISLDCFTDVVHEDMMVCVFSIRRAGIDRMFLALPDKHVQYRGKALLQWLYDNRHRQSLTHCQEIDIPKRD